MAGRIRTVFGQFASSSGVTGLLIDHKDRDGIFVLGRLGGVTRIRRGAVHGIKDSAWLLG